jgi:Flp pilus assembly protein TadD
VRRGAGLLLAVVACLLAAACEKGTHRAARRAWQDLMARGLPAAERAAALEAFVRDYPEPKTNPYLRRACVLLADHHGRAGRQEVAASWYERAVRAEPDDPDLLNVLGYHYARHGLNLDRAVVVLERAVRLAEERGLPPRRQGMIKDSLGWCHRMRGELSLAVALLEEADRLAPGVTAIREHLAQTYRALGENDKALDLYLDLLVRAPGGKEAYRLEIAAIGAEGGPARRRAVERRLEAALRSAAPDDRPAGR